MVTVTFDTNVVDRPELIEAALGAGCGIAVTSTTARELERSDISVTEFELVLETNVFDESRFGEAVLGSEEDAGRLEFILHTISNGSFPAPGNRSGLSEGEEHQLRDAMVLAAHVREGRDIFVTIDVTGFVRHGRRETFEGRFSTWIMTAEEFLEHCATLA